MKLLKVIVLLGTSIYIGLFAAVLHGESLEDDESGNDSDGEESGKNGGNRDFINN